MTKWGTGFRNYSECLEYIQANNIKAPEGGLALPLRYTVYEQPSYSIVSSNQIWKDQSRKDEAKALSKEESDQGRRCLYFPQVLRDGTTCLQVAVCRNLVGNYSLVRLPFKGTNKNIGAFVISTVHKI